MCTQLLGLDVRESMLLTPGLVADLMSLERKRRSPGRESEI